jgi:hypothetical protein
MIKVHFRFWGIGVTAGPNLLQSGWYGGQIVRFTGNMIVEKATPLEVVGVLINGYKLEDYDAKQYKLKDSDGLKISKPYNYENNPTNSNLHMTTMLSDDGMFDINKNAYDTTQVYTHNQRLYSNNNGIITNVNAGGDCIGIVAALPSEVNNWMRVKLKW